MMMMIIVLIILIVFLTGFTSLNLSTFIVLNFNYYVINCLKINHVTILSF